MDIRSSEPDLRALMISGLDGDAAAHRALLERLSGQLRAYFKGQLNRLGRGPVEAEDLVQQALIAIRTRRHTYARSQLFPPWVYSIARYKLLDYRRRTKVSAADVPIDEAQELAVHADSAHVQSSLDRQSLWAELSPKASQAIQ